MKRTADTHTQVDTGGTGPGHPSVDRSQLRAAHLHLSQTTTPNISAGPSAMCWPEPARELLFRTYFNDWCYNTIIILSIFPI